MGQELEGRDAAMGALREALAQANARRGRLVLVTGDAGIGKSALVSALAEEADAASAEVVWGRAWEFAEAPPYFPVRSALRALSIDPLAPTFRGEGGAFALWESVVEALAAEKKTVVWILEDLHAADLQTLDLLTFLAQAVRGLRVLVVGTTRERDQRLDARTTQRLSRMGRDGVDLRLGPLGPSEVGAVAARECGGPLPPSVVAQLAEVTGGNPLFVVECARAFKASGTLGALPPTIREVVLERFRDLSAGARATLEHGAVLGREFTAALVGRMTKALPARVIDDVLPAVRAGLVTEAEPGRFVFSHVLVRDAIEGSLSAEARARIHELAADSLASAGEGVDVAVERARHAVAAATLGDARTAVDLSRRAIALLEEEGAHDRAHALFERLVGASAAAEVGALLTRSDWLHYARIAQSTGRYAEGRKACERVCAEARSAGAAEDFARAALVVGAEIRPAVVDSSLVSLLQEAQRMLGDASPALGCRVQARLAAALQPHADVEVPMRLARDAIARARELGDDVLLEVLDAGAAALVDFAPVEERVATYEEIRALAAARADVPRVLRQHARLAMDLAFIGDFDGFSSHVDEMLRLSAELGHPRYRWRPLLFLSMRAIANGDLDESERAIVEVAQLAALTDDPGLGGSLAAHRFHRTLVLQREDELRAMAAEIPVSLAAFPPALIHCMRAVLLARAGDAEATRTHLQGLSGEGRHFMLREISGACMLAEPFALVGPDEERRDVLALLMPHVDVESMGGHMPVSYDGPVARGVALLEASLGDVASAERHLDAALERARARGHRTWVAQLDYDAARITGSAVRAERAASLATEIGLDAVAAKARAIGGKTKHTAPARAAPVTAPLSLAREGDVWLVARGPRSVRVRDTRGMQLLARLVERADEEIHVLALASDDGGAGLSETSAGDVLDDKARRAYRDRLRELAADIDEAERHGDRGRLEKLRRESDMLEEELGRAVGLGSRARQDGSATERARVNVQRRLKDALARIREADAELGRYLDRAVRTGTFCCFRN